MESVGKTVIFYQKIDFQEPRYIKHYFKCNLLSLYHVCPAEVMPDILQAPFFPPGWLLPDLSHSSNSM